VVTENATFGASGHDAAENGAGGAPGTPEAVGPVTKIVQAS
jgi:hypothetical protein